MTWGRVTYRRQRIKKGHRWTLTYNDQPPFSSRNTSVEHFLKVLVTGICCKEGPIYHWWALWCRTITSIPLYCLFQLPQDRPTNGAAGHNNAAVTCTPPPMQFPLPMPVTRPRSWFPPPAGLYIALPIVALLASPFLRHPCFVLTHKTWGTTMVPPCAPCHHHFVWATCYTTATTWVEEECTMEGAQAAVSRLAIE